MYLFMYNFQVREENKNNWEATWPWRKMDSDKWIMLARPKCNGRQEKTELTAGHLSSCLRAEVSLWPCEKICRYSGYIKCYMWLMFSSIHDIESTICFADGQKIAIRLSKKIARRSNKKWKSSTLPPEQSTSHMPWTTMMSFKSTIPFGQPWLPEKLTTCLLNSSCLCCGIQQEGQMKRKRTWWKTANQPKGSMKSR